MRSMVTVINIGWGRGGGRGVLLAAVLLVLCTLPLRAPALSFVSSSPLPPPRGPYPNPPTALYDCHRSHHAQGVSSLPTGHRRTVSIQDDFWRKPCPSCTCHGQLLLNVSSRSDGSFICSLSPWSVVIIIRSFHPVLFHVMCCCYYLDVSHSNWKPFSLRPYVRDSITSP